MSQTQGTSGAAASAHAATVRPTEVRYEWLWFPARADICYGLARGGINGQWGAWPKASDFQVAISYEHLEIWPKLS